MNSSPSWARTDPPKRIRNTHKKSVRFALPPVIVDVIECLTSPTAVTTSQPRRGEGLLKILNGSRPKLPKLSHMYAQIPTYGGVPGRPRTRCHIENAQNQQSFDHPEWRSALVPRVGSLRCNLAAQRIHEAVLHSRGKLLRSARLQTLLLWLCPSDR